MWEFALRQFLNSSVFYSSTPMNDFVLFDCFSKMKNRTSVLYVKQLKKRPFFHELHEKRAVSNILGKSSKKWLISVL